MADSSVTPTADPGDDAADVALMLQVKAGDERAFERLVERYQSRVIGTVAKMLGCDVEAEDVAQQVFVRVWSSAARYEASAKFTTWLFTITRNLVFNELRRRKRHPATPLEQEEQEHHFQAADPAATPPDASLADAELQSAIQRAIDALPEPQRMAIILRRYEETPYDEMAKILGVTVPAVKSLLFRARADLRRHLAKYLA